MEKSKWRDNFWENIKLQMQYWCREMGMRMCESRIEIGQWEKSKCKDKYLQILGKKIIYKGNIGAGYAQVWKQNWNWPVGKIKI